MTPELRAWLSAAIGGVILAVLGAYDAFANHSNTFSSVGDTTFILGGVGLITGKAIYDLGVQVPPKA
jgi:hypothetical protein